MTGTLINVVTVLCGAAAGAALGARFPERWRQGVMDGIGLVTVVIGMSLALQTKNVIVVLGALLPGALLGEWWRLDDRLRRFGDWVEARGGRLERWFARGQPAAPGRMSKAFVTASLVFCVGPLTIVGSLQDGLRGDFRLLAVKSTLDGFAAMAFASSLGIGVALAAVTVLLYQGALTLSAHALNAVLTDAMVREMSAVGGVMILGLGLVLLEIKHVRVANMLPALALAPFVQALAELWQRYIHV